MKQVLRIGLVLVLVLLVVVGFGKSYKHRVEARNELKKTQLSTRMEEFEEEIEMASVQLEDKLDNIDDLGAELETTMEDIGSDIGINMEKLGIKFGGDMEDWGRNFGKDMAEFGSSIGNTLQEVFTD